MITNLDHDGPSLMIPSFLQPGSTAADTDSYPFLSSLFFVPSQNTQPPPSDDAAPRGLVARMRLGGAARDVADEVVVELHGSRTCRVRGRAGAVLFAGEISRATLVPAASRGSQRADVVLEGLGPRPVKLWLPGAPDDARTWRDAFGDEAPAPAPGPGRDGGARGLEASAASACALGALARRLEKRALPPGWRRATDPASGREYYYEVRSGETTWTKPSSGPLDAARETMAPSTSHLSSSVESKSFRPSFRRIVFSRCVLFRGLKNCVEIVAC
jgi:hypothetical protein